VEKAAENLPKVDETTKTMEQVSDVGVPGIEEDGMKVGKPEKPLKPRSMLRKKNR